MHNMLHLKKTTQFYFCISAITCRLQHFQQSVVGYWYLIYALSFIL